MRSPGTFISTVGHAGLIAWLLLGWGLESDPLEFDTFTVTTISSEAFAEATNRAQAPEPGTAAPDAPVVPEIVDNAPPPVPESAQPVAVAPPPEPVAPPSEEAPPPDPPPPAPQAEVADVAPSAPSAPPPVTPAPDLPTSEDPTPRQADIVTATPTAPPPPDALPDDIAREEAVQAPDAPPEIAEDEQEETAPEETTTEIVNADDTPSAPEEDVVSAAPSTSMRPIVRPRRAAPAPAEEQETQTAEAPAPEPEPETPETDAAVEAALQAALAASEAPAVAAGPPMTGAERDAFRIAVNRCWNVDPGSVAARVTVEVGFQLNRDGTVVGNQVNRLGSEGDQSATNTAFEAARRAILRCQGAGYQLPPDKYEQWKDVVIVFDPSGMRLR